MSHENHPPVDSLDPRVKAVFESARGISIPASPYLKTRVLAQLRERRTSRRTARFWKFLGTFSAAASAAVVALMFYSNPFSSSFEGQVGLPLAVRIEVSPISEQAIEYVRVELPDGVSFHSARFPEMAEKKTLIVHWSPDSGQKLFPVVVRADQAGIREVRVTFLSSHQTPISSKIVKIRFNKSQAVSGGIG